MIELRFPPAGALMSLNDRDHWRVRNTKNQEWVKAAFYAARQAKVPTQPPCTVAVSLPVRGNRRRDPHNFVATVKPIIDGLVQAGVWPDDNSDWVRTVEPVLILGATEVVVTLTPIGAP